MNIPPLDTPRLFAKDVRMWRGFAAQTQAAALAEFARLHPTYAAQMHAAVWCTTNHTLYIPWDWRRE